MSNARSSRWKIPTNLVKSRDPNEGKNPFSKNDRRYGTWQKATAIAEEQCHRHASEYLARTTKRLDQAATLEDGVRAVEDGWSFLSCGCFDIWSNRSLQVVDDHATLEDFERWLVQYADGWIKEIDKFFPSDLAIDNVLMAVQHALCERIEHWRAKGRQRLRD